MNKIGLTVYENTSKLPQSIRDDIRINLPISQAQSYVSHPTTSFDEYSAISKTERLLGSIKAMTLLIDQGIICAWQDYMYVIRKRSTKGVLLRNAALSLQRKTTNAANKGKTVRSVQSYSKKILKNFDRYSTYRLLNALNTSSLAHASSALENKLISIWSAVEVLLSDPEDKVRIEHYVRLLVPCICLRYVRHQTIAIYDNMAANYGRRFFEILKNEPFVLGNDPHTKFAALMFLKENSELRSQLLTLCSDNPLALHRLFKLNRDYGSSKHLKNSIASHEKRVEWQLQRIYRARNHLVHAGRSPSSLDSLILDMDGYFRTIVGTIVNRANKEDDPSNIDQIVTEIGIEYTLFKKNIASIRAEGGLNLPDLKAIIH